MTRQRKHAPKPMQPDAARRAQAYREVGREYATPLPSDALPLPEATRRDIQRATTRDWRGYSPHDYPRNASEPAKPGTEIEQLKAELAQAVKERDEAQKNYAFMVERACNEKLDGYRELGAKCAELERERDEAIQLLYLLDKPDARHPDVAAFLDALEYTRK